MAFATVKTETKTVETEVQEKVVKLELTPEEAEFWCAVTGYIAGSPSSSYRRHSIALSGALGRAGVTYNPGKYVSCGSLYAESVNA